MNGYLFLHQPLPERWTDPGPSQLLVNVRRIAPYPGLQLRFKYDDPASLPPTCGNKLGFHLLFNLDGRSVLPATSVMVKHNQSIMVRTRKTPQEFRRVAATSRIPLNVAVDVVLFLAQIANSQGVTALENAGNSVLRVQVSNQNYQFLCKRCPTHPSTPPANNTPRFTPPFQSRRAGCSEPLTMSVAPLLVFWKHSTVSTSATLRMTGEWVAKRTCAS